MSNPFRNILLFLFCVILFAASGVLLHGAPIQKLQENPQYLKRYREMPDYNEAIRKIAQQEHVILIDHDRRWRKFASDPEALAARLGEPIHPGALGHLEMAKEIFQCLGICDPEANSCNPVGIPFSIPPIKERF